MKFPSCLYELCYTVKRYTVFTSILEGGVTMEEQNMNNAPVVEPEKVGGNDNMGSASGNDHDVEENKVFAALSYLGILVLIPLLAKKDSKFAQFHAKQGLVFLIVFIAGWLVFWIPIIGWLLWIAVVALNIIGLVQALMGKWWEAPVIGPLAKKLNL